MRKVFVFLLVLLSSQIHAQSISDLINEVNLDSLTLKLNEFSGEIPTNVNGTDVTILNRVSNSDNNLAADYLFQKLSSYSNLTVTNQVYNPGSNGGRNIIAVQEGQTNPNDIYIICGHYDSVANYCADDNASGTVAVLEVARILSQQCLDNTIIYALWDEEEIGLLGSQFYANQAATNGDNILGVINMDMMAYDSDNDNIFDIDVRPFANSIGVKDDIISVLNTSGINLTYQVVNPGTFSSDHSPFWNNGFSAVLLGESWANNDQTPQYHSSGDRFATLNIPYYFKMVQLVMAYTATKGGLLSIDNSITQNEATLTANQGGATYQWKNCDTNNDIAGATNQSFTATSNGNYAVAITMFGCTELSNCFLYNALSVSEFSEIDFKLYPNPTNHFINIEFPNFNEARFEIYTLNGKAIMKGNLMDNNYKIDVKDFTKGIYFIKLKVDNSEVAVKFIKD